MRVHIPQSRDQILSARIDDLRAWRDGDHTRRSHRLNMAAYNHDSLGHDTATQYHIDHGDAIEDQSGRLHDRLNTDGGDTSARPASSAQEEATQSLQNAIPEEPRSSLAHHWLAMNRRKQSRYL
jgi:hypothetical protein